MAKHIKRISIQTVGVLFLMLGVIGMVLPILQGVLFFILGLVLLSLYSPFAEAVLHRIGRAHPRVEQVILKARFVIAKYVQV